MPEVKENKDIIAAHTSKLDGSISLAKEYLRLLSYIYHEDGVTDQVKSAKKDSIGKLCKREYIIQGGKCLAHGSQDFMSIKDCLRIII